MNFTSVNYVLKGTHHFWAGRHLGWWSELRLEVVRTEALLGEGVGGTLRRLHQQGGGRGGGGAGQLYWLLLQVRILDESPLDWCVVLLLRLLLHHVDVEAGTDVARLAARLLSLLGSVFVVWVLHLVQQSQLLRLRSVGSSLLLGQSLPLLAQVLEERRVRKQSTLTLVIRTSHMARTKNYLDLNNYHWGED